MEVEAKHHGGSRTLAAGLSRRPCMSMPLFSGFPLGPKGPMLSCASVGLSSFAYTLQAPESQGGDGIRPVADTSSLVLSPFRNVPGHEA